MNYIKYIIRDIKSYHAIFLANPLLALVAIPLYLIPIGLLLGVTVGFILLVEGRPKWQSLDKYLNLIFMFSTFTSLVFASDLVLVQILAVLGNIRLGINRFEIARIAQAVLLTILLFGSIYYYMQLYNNDASFKNIHPTRFKSTSPPLSPAFFVKGIFHVPPSETVVDCIYFSVVSITTVGYGDIYPATSAAKLVSMVEIVLGYLLLVISIGAVAGSSVSGSECGSKSKGDGSS